MKPTKLMFLRVLLVVLAFNLHRLPCSFDYHVVGVTNK